MSYQHLRVRIRLLVQRRVHHIPPILVNRKLIFHRYHGIRRKFFIFLIGRKSVRHQLSNILQMNSFFLHDAYVFKYFVHFY